MRWEMKLRKVDRWNPVPAALGRKAVKEEPWVSSHQALHRARMVQRKIRKIKT